MLSTFIVASLILAVTPGPAVLYLLTRTLAHGRRAGLASMAGVAFGNFGNALGASLGLAALLAISSLAFTFVKLAGAGYLIYLGIRALRPASVSDVPDLPRTPASWRVFRDGFLVALLNPKTALFFAAFLPQFIDPSASAITQSVLLGALFVLVAASTDTVYVLAAGRIAPALVGLKGARRYGSYMTASVFIGLGIYTALSGPRTSK